MPDVTQQRLDRETSIVTPEHVLLRFQTAGLGSRAIAHIIDTVILSLVNLTVFLVFVLVIFGKEPDDFLETQSLAMGIIILFVFLFNFGYYLVLEAFWSGQTVGKRMTGLRVMRDNGQPITFLAAAIRNLFRIVDNLPMGYFLGAVVSFFHPQDKRIGDLVAGTIVVVESGRRAKRSQKTPAGLNHMATAQPLALHLDEAQRRLITREDWQLLTAFLSRMPALSPKKSEELGAQLAQLLANKLGVQAEQWSREDPIAFLQQLHGILQKEWQLNPLE